MIKDVRWSGWVWVGEFLLVPAYPGSPGSMAIKRVCVCVCKVGGRYNVLPELAHHLVRSCADWVPTHRASLWLLHGLPSTHAHLPGRRRKHFRLLTYHMHMAQLMPLPLTVSCFSKIQIGSTFLVRLTRVVLDKGPKWLCVFVSKRDQTNDIRLSRLST